MTKVIYKYPLTGVTTTIDLPKGAKVLSFQVQRGNACIWVLLDIGPVELETRTFRFWGTGHPMEDVPMKYIGTFQLDEGSLVFHLFEV
jgi:hypothetical protein